MITTPVTPDLVRGALELEDTGRGLLPHRLPAVARAQSVDPQLAMAESQPSGVRLALRTAARVLEVDVIATKRRYVGAPPAPGRDPRAAGRRDTGRRRQRRRRRRAAHRHAVRHLRGRAG